MGQCAVLMADDAPPWWGSLLSPCGCLSTYGLQSGGGLWIQCHIVYLPSVCVFFPPSSIILAEIMAFIPTDANPCL